MGYIKKFVDDEVDEIEKLGLVKKHGQPSQMLLSLKFEDGVNHIHYPPDDELALETWKQIAEEKNLKKPALVEYKGTELKEEEQKNRKIIFAHNRAAGDCLMFSAGVRDFSLMFPNITINVDTNQSWIWENNPYIDRSLKKEDEGVEYYKVGYPMIASVNNINMHFTSMFFFDMIAITDLHKKLPISLGEFCASFANGEVGDPCIGKPEKNPQSYEPFISLVNKYRNFGKDFMRQRGDLHMTDEEKKYNMIKEKYGVEKYWVIAPGGKRDATTKIWDWRKFQEVIEYFKGKLTFVVIGRSDHLIHNDLRDVIDLTDKTENLRDLVPIVYHADGCVSGPSLLMHLSAAVPPRIGSERKPCVTILGGREPSAWTWYCNHQVLHTNGVFTCCDNGGCWEARVVPVAKDPKHNKNLCKLPVQVDGRTVQSCMEVISGEDVARAIELYYQGDIYTYSKSSVATMSTEPILVSQEEAKQVERNCEIAREYVDEVLCKEKQINLVGNLNTAGGGEQSLLTIAREFIRADWQVKLFPWGSVHKNYKDYGIPIEEVNFKQDDGITMAKNMLPAPLLFYGNDCVWDFCKTAQPIVEKCSNLIVGINYMLGHFKDPKYSNWLDKSGKLKAVIFQNEEKKEDWDRQVIGFEDTKKIVLFGAIDIEKFFEVCTPERNKGDKLVILKHCVSDYRKYLTNDSVHKGEKPHIWQKHLDKELDIKFYGRLLKDTKDVVFMFMEAHDELEQHFKKESRMKFYKWDEIPVAEFLSKGHMYLYRTSNLWRDNYPRVVAEALAAGLPVLSEPRDGTKDRIQHGDTGFHCVDYDGFLYAIKLLQRKEKYRIAMGVKAKEWAMEKLNPKRWVQTIEEVLST
jgi:ADP-heptose:LPS heptosyltransferase/glycosyltransferase involved in cell wall biosynthesis